MTHTRQSKTILVDAWNTLFTEKGVDHALQTLLETFSHSKIVLTNATDEEQKQFGMDSSPYPVFTLAHNPNKSNPIYYKTMLARFNLNTRNVVYFEHNLAAVESARSVGITTLQFDKNVRNIAQVEAFLRENL